MSAHCLLCIHVKHTAVWLLMIAVLSVFALPSLTLAQQTVIYPRPESVADVRASYPVALLNLCEQKYPNAIIFQPSSVHTQQGRSIRQLIKGDGMGVVWALTNEERETLLLPIRVPIDRGLIGWRLLLIRNSDADTFETVFTKEQLALLTAGQGHDWPDVNVLRENHFRLATASTYPSLFHMLARGHIDYFPRAISEIWPELEAQKSLNIAVQKHLIIHYPAAFYFFVNKHNVLLAKALETCLNAAITDGSLQRLFNQYYQQAILKADLSHRTIIQLNNPSLPKATPLENSMYWFSPVEAR